VGTSVVCQRHVQEPMTASRYQNVETRPEVQD
jgi:hypothetical protein